MRHAMNPKLEERLRKLNWDDIRDWVDDRTAQRGWKYRDKVGEIVAVGEAESVVEREV